MKKKLKPAMKINWEKRAMATKEKVKKITELEKRLNNIYEVLIKQHKKGEISPKEFLDKIEQARKKGQELLENITKTN